MHHPENDEQYKGLTVNKGVENLPTVNPYARFSRKKRVLTPEDYFRGIRDGNISVLGQAVTLVESSLPEDQLIAQRVIEMCLPAIPFASASLVYRVQVSPPLSKRWERTSPTVANTWQS